MKLYTLEEVSKELRISVKTARSRISKHKNMPPALKIGRRYLFPAIEFEAWVKETIKPSSFNKIPQD